MFFEPRHLHHLHTAVCKRELGSGGFANVKLYQCDEVHGHRICDRLFVVKEMRFDIDCWNREDMKLKYQTIRESLVNEYEIGRQLEHPNIIKTIDIDEEKHALILEHVTGIDMLDYLNESGCKEESYLLQSFIKVLDALEYMHELGIAHMDIKLENVLLDTDNHQVKLIDLGQAKRFLKDGAYQWGTTVCGTDIYFPPEFYKIKRYRPDKVDIWCCGVLLYNLVFDRMPWKKAHKYSDRFFAFCEPYFLQGELPSQLFKHTDIKIKNLTQQDFDVIDEIFKSVFQIKPSKRPTITEFKQKVLEISLFQRKGFNS
jgi:serine/threonine protein kinase